VVQSFDGVAMALVPPGCFQMGSNRLFLDEEPVTVICIEQAFWIDRYEVSNAQFQQLDGVAAQPGRWNLPDRPREQISWFEARDFCTRRGARLPTEAEWEYAARGPDGLTWPWGHTFRPDAVVYGDNSGGETADVGSRPDGASWVGALDMSGNVREWVSSLYMPYPYRNDDGREADTAELANSPRVLRGGTFDLLNGTDGSVRAMRRAWSGPNYGSETDGFRCVRDYGDPESPPDTPVPTSPAASIARVIVTAPSVNLRAGPGTAFIRLSGAARGETFPVTGRTTDGNWYQVTLLDGRAAWLSANLVQLSPPDASVPVVTDTLGAGS
jgi:iron(II)-dependent oxidoreductase